MSKLPGNGGTQGTTREGQKSASGPGPRKAPSALTKICAILAAMNSTMPPDDAIRIEQAWTRLGERLLTFPKTR
jgi:hypothetical protein